MSSISCLKWRRVEPLALKFSLGLIRFDARKLMAFTAHLAGRPFDEDPRALLEAKGVGVVELLACPVDRRARTISFPPGCIRYVGDRETRSYVEVAGTFDACLKHKTAKRRNDIGRRVRRWREVNLGAEGIREFRTPAEVSDFYRLACTVSAKTYQARDLGLGIPLLQSYRAELQAAAAEDRFRGWILFLGDAPVAFSYGLGAGDIMVGVRMGFDPAYAALRPGSVLLHLLMGRLWTDRFQRVDLGTSGYEYKTLYETGRYEAARVLYFRRSGASLVIVLALAALEILRSGGRAAALLAGVTGRRRRMLEVRLRRTLTRIAHLKRHDASGRLPHS